MQLGIGLSHVITQYDSLSWIKSAGAAFKPKGAVGKPASWTDLSGNGKTMNNPGTDPDWDATNGWTHIAANTDYLVTTYKLNSGQSWLIRYADAGTSTASIFGAGTGTKRTGVLPDDSGTLKVYLGGTLNSCGAAVSGGIVCVAGDTVYVDGVLRQAGLSDGGDWPTGLNTNVGRGGDATYIDVKVQAFACYNRVLSPREVALFTLQMNQI